MPTLTEPRRSRERLRPGSDTLALGLAAVAVLAVGWLMPLDSPDTVDLTVDNPTPYHLNVQVGEVGVGAAPKQQTHRFHEVVDQGDEWVVRLSNAGVVADTITINRQVLADSGWRIEVAPEVTDQLDAAGVPLSP